MDRQCETSRPSVNAFGFSQLTFAEFARIGLLAASAMRQSSAFERLPNENRVRDRSMRPMSEGKIVTCP